MLQFAALQPGSRVNFRIRPRELLVFCERIWIICCDGPQANLWQHDVPVPAQRHHKGMRHVYILAATVGSIRGSNKVRSGNLLTNLLTYLLTNLLTPYSTVLLVNLPGSQLVKKFPTFHGSRRFITALTNTRHLSLSWSTSIQSVPQLQLPEDPS